MSYVDENTGELLDEEFAMSLERWTEQRVEEGMALADSILLTVARNTGEFSDCRAVL